MAQIGNHLPRFGKYQELFRTNDRVKHVLYIFYKDILDFHATVLNFFKLKSMSCCHIRSSLLCVWLKHLEWRVFFESIWPRYASKISVILENITRHTILVDSEVTLADISEAHAARIRAYEEYERAQNFQQRQQFEIVKSSLSPKLYDVDLDNLQRQSYGDAGQWLDDEEDFRKWSDPNDESARLLWLEGIPGAGAIFLITEAFNYC
jgi:hypothetical protein